MQTVPVYYSGLINAAEAENNKNEKRVAIFSLSTVMVRHWRRETFNQRNYFYISGRASGLMREKYIVDKIPPSLHFITLIKERQHFPFIIFYFLSSPALHAMRIFSGKKGGS